MSSTDSVKVRVWTRGSLGADDHLLEGVHLSLVSGVGERVEDLLASLGLEVTEVLEALSADAPSELHVLLHDGNSASVNRAEIGILEQSSEVALSSFLQSEEGLGLEAQLAINAVADSADESLEGCFGQKKISGFLVLLDLTKSDSTGAEPELLLHAPLSRRGLLDNSLAFACSGRCGGLAALGI